MVLFPTLSIFLRLCRRQKSLSLSVCTSFHTGKTYVDSNWDSLKVFPTYAFSAKTPPHPKSVSIALTKTAFAFFQVPFHPNLCLTDCWVTLHPLRHYFDPNIRPIYPWLVPVWPFREIFLEIYSQPLKYSNSFCWFMETLAMNFFELKTYAAIINIIFCTYYLLPFIFNQDKLLIHIFCCFLHIINFSKFYSFNIIIFVKSKLKQTQINKSMIF